MDRYTFIFSIITALLVVTLLACKTNMQSKNGTETSISVGFGGGFAGIYNLYEFHENGDIYKVSYFEQDNKQIIGTLEKNQTKQLFSLPAQLALEEHAMDQPGNMTYWIEYRGTTDYTIKWGSESERPHKNVQLFYDILQQAISKIDQTDNK